MFPLPARPGLDGEPPVIDIDRIDEQLAAAASPPRGGSVATPRTGGAAPARAARPPRRWGGADRSSSGPQLLELGLVEEAVAAMARATDGHDALTWATMRALLDGRRAAAAAGIDELRAVAKDGVDPEAPDRYWVPRLWAAVEWGADEERYEVLDHCRARAYRFDDLHWWGNLTLLLAVMGKHDEATRAFDEAHVLLSGVVENAAWLDVLANLIEAAALLGDPNRVVAAGHALRWPQDRLVVVGRGVVCKGSVERYRALTHGAAGRGTKAEECFARAQAVHRAIGAGPLLRRTLQQASGGTLAA